MVAHDSAGCPDRSQPASVHGFKMSVKAISSARQIGPWNGKVVAAQATSILLVLGGNAGGQSHRAYGDADP